VVSGTRTLYASASVEPPRSRHVTLLDLIDRLLAGGVVIHGDITLAVADIDLIDVRLALLLAATQKVLEQ
jgi:Gas vesicle protein